MKHIKFILKFQSFSGNTENKALTYEKTVHRWILQNRNTAKF